MKKILLFLLIPASVYAQDKHAALIAQYLKGQHDFYKFNGSVLVAEKGKPIYQQALGYADFNTQRTLNDSSVFELASVSKQFTATGIMILKEKGSLKYEDEVKKFIPDFPYDHITIHQLLTHSSGLPSYEDQFEKYWDHKKIAHNKDVIDMLIARHDTLDFIPGSKWKYSNTGYAVLAFLIEKLGHQSYNDFLARNIFRPLQMNHTYVYNTRRSENLIPDNYSLGFLYSDSLHRYILPDSMPELDMVYYLDGIVGDGCVNSTTADLLKWVNALHSNKLLPAAAINEMTSPLVQLNPKDSSTYYGFGLFIEPHNANGKLIWHTGGWPGYVTRISWYPEKDETIIILSNNGTNNSLIDAGLKSILADEPLIMPYAHREIKIDSAVFRRFVGKYSAIMILELTSKDGKLFRHREGTPDIELIPESNTKFFYGDGSDRQMEFELDGSGKVVKAWFINSGQKGEMKRID